MNNIMEDINEHEIDGLIQTMKEMGIKGLMKYTDVLVLNHMINRKWIPPIEQRDELIKTLKGESDMEYNQIMNLINRYGEWKSVLPSYSLRLNQNLDGINKRMNSVIPFQYIGNSPNKRLVGFVDEGSDINIYDGIGKNLILLGSVDKKSWSISWGNNSLLQQEHTSYITSSVRKLKEQKIV
jgi:hypothetical protein